MFPLINQINEAIGDLNEAADRLIQAIRNCPELAQLPDGQMLFRGYGNEYSQHDVVFTKPIRTDRTPRDLHLRWHNLFDDFFEQKFGIRFRSASLFTTGYFVAASHYGTPYIVIPAGGFKFCWSPAIEDPVNEPQLRAEPPESVTKLHDNGMMGTYRVDNFAGAVASDCEVMIHAPSATFLKAKLEPAQLSGLIQAIAEQGIDVGAPRDAKQLFTALVKAIHG